jgi:hypothetical protein
MTENLMNSAGTPQPSGKRKLKRAGRAIQIWLRELIHSLLEITILFAATAVLAGILLSLMEAFWYLYLETPVGIKYTSNPSRLSPHLLTQLFKQDLFLFSIEVATATLTACLTISAAFQILALRRYFYLGRGLLNRLVVLSLFSAATAFKLADTSDIDVLAALGISIIPSLCLFPSCMNISARILPELTPLGIMEIFIHIKTFLIHSDDRAIPEPQASLSPQYSVSSQPLPARKPATAIKNRGAGRVTSDARRAV